MARVDAAGAHELGLLSLCDGFNPGQYYAFYALLERWPLIVLGQNIAGAIAEAVGYTGLLQFVLRAPDDEPDRKWRWLERILSVIAFILAVLMVSTYGNLTGYRTEFGTRFSILAGFVVAVCAVAILVERTQRHARAFGEGSTVPCGRGIRPRARTALWVQPPGARGPGVKSAPLFCPGALWAACLRRRPRCQRARHAEADCPECRRRLRRARDNDLRHKISTLERKLSGNAPAPKKRSRP